MKILLICYSYPPHISPRSIRWSAIAEHWAAQGKDVHVIASSLPGALQHEVLNGVTVHRVGGKLTERIRGMLSMSHSQPKSVSHQEPTDTPHPNTPTIKETFFHKQYARLKTRLKNSLLQGIKRVCNTLWKTIYWPDYACLWSFAATKIARQLTHDQSFDALVTTSLPFTDHLVGLQITKQHQSLPWLVDIGDPFSFGKSVALNNQYLYRRLSRRAEKQLLTAGHAISVTTEKTGEIYADLFPEAADRIQVIPPLLREDLMQPNNANEKQTHSIFPQNNSSSENPRRLRIAFIGTLYPRIRSPEHILTMFRELLASDIGSQLELHFFGPMNHCEPFFEPFHALNGIQIFQHGPVSHAIARQVMTEADILLNIGNATTYQLPSKIVEYASTGKPIINITTVADDSSSELLQTYPQAISLKLADRQDINSQSISQLLLFLKESRPCDPQTIRQWCKPFQLDAIAQQYDALLEAACQQQAMSLQHDSTSTPVTVNSETATNNQSDHNQAA